MNRQQLETWLCDGAADPSLMEIAELIGVPFDEIGDSTLLRVADRVLALRFTVAVLRDVFDDDRGVELWLRAPRPELGALSALDLVRAGEMAPVETLAVHEWNDAASSAPGVPGDETAAAAVARPRDYGQSVGRSSATRAASSDETDVAEVDEVADVDEDWPADPTFSTVAAD